MILDEIRVWYAIAVGEYQILASTRGDRLVQDPALLESFIGLPDVFDRDVDLFRQPVDNLSGFIARAIISHNNLEIPITLRCESPQGFLQPFRVVIGGKNNRSEHRSSGLAVFGSGFPVFHIVDGY